MSRHWPKTYECSRSSEQDTWANYKHECYNNRRLCSTISAGRPAYATLCKNTHDNQTTSQTARCARTSAVGLWQYTAAINAITSESKPTRDIYVQVQEPDNVMISISCLNDVVAGSVYWFQIQSWAYGTKLWVYNKDYGEMSKLLCLSSNDISLHVLAGRKRKTLIVSATHKSTCNRPRKHSDQDINTKVFEQNYRHSHKN